MPLNYTPKNGKNGRFYGMNILWEFSKIAKIPKEVTELLSNANGMSVHKHHSPKVSSSY